MQNHNTRTLPPKLARALRPLEQAARLSEKLPARFWMDDYLQATYELYLRWERKNVAQKRSRRLAIVRKIKTTKRSHPIRIILAATSPVTDSKILSRWTRALELAAFKNIEPEQLSRFIRDNGGLAGCAQEMARFEPKRRANCESAADPTVAPLVHESREMDESLSDDQDECKDWTTPKTGRRAALRRRAQSWSGQTSEHVNSWKRGRDSGW